MTREEYARNYSGKVHEPFVGRVIIPADVKRVSIHEPCPFCGTARGLCRHRRAVA